MILLRVSHRTLNTRILRLYGWSRLYFPYYFPFVWCSNYDLLGDISEGSFTDDEAAITLLSLRDILRASILRTSSFSILHSRAYSHCILLSFNPTHHRRLLYSLANMVLSVLIGVLLQCCVIGNQSDTLLQRIFS